MDIYAAAAFEAMLGVRVVAKSPGLAGYYILEVTVERAPTPAWRGLIYRPESSHGGHQESGWAIPLSQAGLYLDRQTLTP
jgi:hypothetical protein